MKVGETLSAELLDRVVTGVNLAPGTLRDQLGEGPELLVFLRHFGCIFCRETLADMRAAAEGDARFPSRLVFFQGSPIEGKAFLRRDWPDLRAVSDREGRFYEAFGIERGGLVKMFQPAVWSARSRAQAKGHENGARVGDIWRMPGVFLVRGGEVMWTHEFRHAADHPDYREICERAASAAAS